MFLPLKMCGRIKFQLQKGHEKRLARFVIHAFEGTDVLLRCIVECTQFFAIAFLQGWNFNDLLHVLRGLVWGN